MFLSRCCCCHNNVNFQFTNEFMALGIYAPLRHAFVMFRGAFPCLFETRRINFPANDRKQFPDKCAQAGDLPMRIESWNVVVGIRVRVLFGFCFVIDERSFISSSFRSFTVSLFIASLRAQKNPFSRHHEVVNKRISIEIYRLRSRGFIITIYEPLNW